MCGIVSRFGVRELEELQGELDHVLELRDDGHQSSVSTLRRQTLVTLTNARNVDQGLALELRDRVQFQFLQNNKYGYLDEPKEKYRDLKVSRKCLGRLVISDLVVDVYNSASKPWFITD
ncbi:hypothetical protein B0H10DRAFT_1958876 [Mycena sp. CBHHK59/15]|nr:hypothetical protein B0H10DRAFT_1958876 [Mycena sp. CBHHK59/15]